MLRLISFEFFSNWAISYAWVTGGSLFFTILDALLNSGDEPDEDNPAKPFFLFVIHNKSSSRLMLGTVQFV